MLFLLFKILNIFYIKEFQDFKVPGRIVLDIKTGGSIAELLSPQSTIEKSRASNRATSAPVKRLVPTAPPAQSSSTESNDSFTDSQILPDDEAGSKQDIEQNEKDSGQNGENKSDIIAASDRSPDCEPKQIESSDSVASAANDLFPVAVKISAHNSDNLKPLDYLENSTQAKAVDKDIANEQNSVGAEIEPTELTPTVVTASFERGNVLNSNQLKPLTSQLASPEERQRGRMTRGMSFSEELKEVAWTRSKFLQENEIMESAYATDESYTNTPSESRHASPIRAKNAIIESADSNDDREVPSPATYVPCSDDADFKVLYGAEGNTVNSRIFSVPSTETETSGKSGDNSSISGDVFQDKLEEMFNYMELQNVQLDNLRADVHRAVEVKKQKKILDQQELNSNLVSQSVNEDSSPSLPVSTQYPFHLLSSIPEGNIVESFDDNDGDYVYDYNMKTFRRSNSADVSIDNLPAISFSVDSLHSRDEMVYHPSHSGNHSVDAWLFNEKKDLLPSALPSESNVSADEIDVPQSVKEIPEFIAKAVVQETVSNTTSAEVSRLETKEESTSSTPELTTFSSKKDLLEGLMKDPASIRRRSDPNMKTSLTPWKDDPEYIVKQQEKSILEPPIETKLPSTNTSNAIKSAPAQESRKMSVDLQALIKQSSLKHKEPDEPTTIQNIVKEDQPNSTLSENSIDKNIEEAPLNADGKVKNEEIDNNGEDEMNSEWFTSPNDVGNGKERRKSNGEKRRLSFDDFVMELKFKANKERTSSLASYRHSKLVEIVLQLEAEVCPSSESILRLK